MLRAVGCMAEFEGVLAGMKQCFVGGSSVRRAQGALPTHTHTHIGTNDWIPRATFTQPSGLRGLRT